ncbi:MAG: glutathione peroxidase [Myxococcota bacterium]
MRHTALTTLMVFIALLGASPAFAGALDGLTLKGLSGAPVATDATAGKVVLFVNVASRCGFTPQYDGLQALYESFRDDGLVIIGVPCNQFGGQEPGTAEEIQTFCRANYGVSFPLLEKQDVNGADRSPLYTRLIGSPVGEDKPIRWNFEKFLVGRDGEVVARFSSRVTPDDPALRKAIAEALAAKP